MDENKILGAYSRFPILRGGTTPFSSLHVSTTQFAVAAKNRVWAGDLTFVQTRTGWLTVAVLLDLYSRRVAGWAMSPR